MTDTGFSDQDWQLIEVFRRRVEELNEIWDGLEPKQLSAHMVKSPEGKHSGSANFPPDKDLKAYYMAFRFFYLNDDPSNFLKMRNLFSRSITTPKFGLLMKMVKTQWKDTLGKSHMSGFYEKKMNGDALLDLWFNAHYFHSDLEKLPKLDDINEFLSEEISRFFLYTTVFKASLPVNILYRSTKLLTKAGGAVKIPLWLIEEEDDCINGVRLDLFE